MTALGVNIAAACAGWLLAVVGFLAYLSIRVEKRQHWRYVGAALGMFTGSLALRGACLVWTHLHGFEAALFGLPVSVAGGFAAAQVGSTVAVALLALAVHGRNVRETGAWEVTKAPPWISRRLGWSALAALVAVVVVAAVSSSLFPLPTRERLAACPDPSVHDPAYEDRIATGTVEELAVEIVDLLAAVEGLSRQLERAEEIQSRLDAIWLVLVDAGYRPRTRGEPPTRERENHP